MLIRYVINELSNEKLQNVWCVLQVIEDSLDYKEPLTSISVNLRQEKCNISPEKVYDILEYFEWRGILRIIKRTNKFLGKLNAVPVKIFRKKFDLKYGEVKTELESRSKKGGKSESINEIICVRPRSGNKFQVVINGNYQNTIKGDKAKDSWNLLFEAAEKKEIWYDQTYKSSLDLLNSNAKCRLYTQTGYKITKILKVEGGQIVPNIKMEVINEKAFKTRLKKAKKS